MNIMDNKQNKHLVYFCVFHNELYIDLLNILMKTIKMYSKYDTIDFLVMTSPDFGPLVDTISNKLQISIQKKYFDFNTMHQAACARLHIHEYENIDLYEKILYLDTDIIIQNDLTTLFSTELENKVYAVSEDKISSEWFGSWFFDFNKIDKNTPGLNSGILLFNNTLVIKELFDAIKSHIKQMKDDNLRLPCLCDQPFISYHCISKNLYSYDLMSIYAKLITYPPVVNEPSDIIMCHFIWPIGNAQHKKDRMMFYSKNMLNNYKNILKNKEDFISPSIQGNKYTWNNGFIELHLNGLLVTLWGNGTYDWLDKYTMHARWCGVVHTVRFNDNYTEYFSLRNHDLDFVFGSKIYNR